VRVVSAPAAGCRLAPFAWPLSAAGMSFRATGFVWSVPVGLVRDGDRTMVAMNTIAAIKANPITHGISTGRRRDPSVPFRGSVASRERGVAGATIFAKGVRSQNRCEIGCGRFARLATLKTGYRRLGFDIQGKSFGECIAKHHVHFVQSLLAFCCKVA
jgi:hypothetical protein